MPGNFAMQMESFANSVLYNKVPEVTGLEGLKALKVLHAAYESYRTKKMIKVKIDI
jgi:predicted dehydrogenase